MKKILFVVTMAIAMSSCGHRTTKTSESSSVDTVFVSGDSLNVGGDSLNVEGDSVSIINHE